MSEVLAGSRRGGAGADELPHASSGMPAATWPPTTTPTWEARANRERAWSRQAEAYEGSVGRSRSEVAASAEAAAPAASEAGLPGPQV